MVCYLGCLAEFGAHARTLDEAASVGPPFTFPFPIDGDKVGPVTSANAPTTPLPLCMSLILTCISSICLPHLLSLSVCRMGIKQ